MRWLSRFAILFYLSVLCTPQAFAVHDVRLSPIADTQLQALLPALPVHSHNTAQGDTDDPPALLSEAPVNRSDVCLSKAAVALAVFSNTAVLLPHQARAPPGFLVQ